MLRSNHPKARLQQMQLKWRDVCSVPCGVTVDPNAVYRVGGGTLRPTPTFKMPRPAGEVLVDADVGSNIKHWVGFGLGLGGAITAGLGLLYLTAFKSTTTDLSGNRVEELNTAVGITYLVIGGILMAVGIPLWAGSNSSVEVR